MATNHYVLNTYDLEVPENGWGNSHIWLAAGDGVPLTLHRVDISLEATAQPYDLRDTFHLDIGRLPSMDSVNEAADEENVVLGPVVGADTGGQDNNPVLKPLAAGSPAASLSAYWASGFTRAYQGPWMWTSDASRSHHELDLSGFGGFEVDGGGVVHIAFAHDSIYYGQAYRLALLLSEETS